MVKDMRLKIAAALLATVVSVLGAAQAHAAPVDATRYVCDRRQQLVVIRSATEAQVRFIDRTYDLRRRPSGLGIKYASATATLILDGPSAVFVAEDRLQLGACVEPFDTAAVAVLEQRR